MRVLLVLLALFGFSGPAAAFSEADRAAIQSTIEQQLQAFLRDDGATAYSFAAPTIKQIYPTVESFMAMVRQGYPQVYRPRSHSFGELTEEPGYLTQSVDMSMRRAASGRLSTRSARSRTARGRSPAAIS